MWQRYHLVVPALAPLAVAALLLFQARPSVVSATAEAKGSGNASPRVHRLLDEEGWRFYKLESQSQSIALEPGKDCNVPYCMPGFDDKDWRLLQLPHDMVIENNFSQDADKLHGYLPYSIGWYRLHFEIPSSAAGHYLRLDFDGAQCHSTVYLNGKYIGSHSSGYTSFSFDITNVVLHGKENVLAVLVDATHPDSSWYVGGGIHRHVWLTTLHPVHVDKWGVYLPAVVSGEIVDFRRADAVVKSQTTLSNTGSESVKGVVTHRVFDASGKQMHSSSVAVLIQAGSTTTVSVPMAVSQVELWSDTHPVLHTCITTVTSDGGDVLDEIRTTFGVRKLEWNADVGLILNGKRTKIKGMCNHEDFAGVGMAVPDQLQGFRVHMIKEMGANGWRSGTNPTVEAVLDECDRRGLLFWAENHRNLESPDMIEDLRSLILRDRNHPSIVVWSLCNEGGLCTNFNATTAKVLKKIVKSLDPDGQRPVTASMNIKAGTYPEFQSVLDLAGFNYHPQYYDRNHQMHPDQPMIGSETSSDYSDRSIYVNDPDVKKYVSAYDKNYPRWGTTAENAWCAIAHRDFVAGGFYWSGFDYKGEPTPYGWPNVNSHFGVIDIAGFPKDNFFYHQSVFYSAEDKGVLHILPHWNWDRLPCLNVSKCRYDKEGRRLIDVWAYSNGASVELWLNDRSLGRQNMTACRHVSWDVPFEAGELHAVSYTDDEQVLSTVSVSTTGEAEAIHLSVDWPLDAPKAGDTVLVRAQLVDGKGQFVPTATLPLHFTLSGAAEIIGVGNGDPSCHEADKPPTASMASRTAWNGLARVVIRANGDSFQLKATGIGMQPATLSVGPSQLAA